MKVIGDTRERGIRELRGMDWIISCCLSKARGMGFKESYGE